MKQIQLDIQDIKNSIESTYRRMSQYEDWISEAEDRIFISHHEKNDFSKTDGVMTNESNDCKEE